ncbi:HIT family protein [Kitasatospora sp. NPDC101801]|uniref:HIT family protein n=1 Tax=Kitasatospora sp. NPDC101801 TaxID=3364103 RepID=UPI0038084F9D
MSRHRTWPPPAAAPRDRPGECVFCLIVAGRAPARVVRRWPDALALHPLGPVTPGHLLVIPVRHATDFTSDPDISALVMRRAAELAVPPCNAISSAGALATQTVFHLHIHVLPRSAADGLLMPWSDPGGPDELRSSGCGCRVE